MTIENITNPGVEPEARDKVKETLPSGGSVTKTYYPPATPEPPIPILYVDIAITDPDHTGTPGVKNDGVDTVNMVITLKTEDENIFPANDAFRIIMRDGDNKEYSVIKILFENGVSIFDFKTAFRSATVHVSEADLVIPGMDFSFKVRGANRLFIYEDFTS